MPVTRKILRRIISIFILCAMILSCAVMASSCKRQQGQVAMSLTISDNTTNISSNIYSYYMSVYKTRALVSYYLSMGYTINDLEKMTDIPELWRQLQSEGVTVGDYIKAEAEKPIAQILAIAAYCQVHDLSLTREQRKNIDEFIREITALSKYKNKAAFNAELINYNINDQIFKDIKRTELLADVFYRHLFDQETGKRQIAAEDIDNVYQQSCVRFKHIMLSKNPGTNDVEGVPIEYTEEELAEIEAKIDDWYKRILNGENIENFYAESGDELALYLPEGYTFGEDTDFPSEVIGTAFEIEIGEVRRIETAAGFHIIQKFTLLTADQAVDIGATQAAGGSNYISWADTIRKMIQASLAARELEPYIAKIKFNREQTDLFRIETSAVMFDSPYLWN